jgi:hypothetical protein
MDHPPWNVSLFVEHGFFRKRDNKTHLNFYKIKVVLLIYGTMLRTLDFNVWIPNVGVIGINRCLELNVEFREAYSTRIAHIWSPTIHINCILFHVEFEDGLSISVLKDRATRHKNVQLKIIKFLKKSNVFQTPPFSNTVCVKTWPMSEHSKWQGHVQKKSHGDCFR